MNRHSAELSKIRQHFRNTYKVFQKLNLSKNVRNKKFAPKLISFDLNQIFFDIED